MPWSERDRVPRALGRTAGKGWSTSTYADAGYAPDRLSLASLRFRGVRFWLAGISLFAFGVAYVSPVIQALRVASAPAAPLPVFEIPQLSFAPFGIPKLRTPAAPVTAPAAHAGRPSVQRATRAPGSSAAATTRRAVPAAPPTPRAVPVVENSYTIAPTAPAQATTPADPFEGVPTVDDTVGTAPPPAPEAQPAAQPAPAAPAEDPAAATSDENAYPAPSSLVANESVVDAGADASAPAADDSAAATDEPAVTTEATAPEHHFPNQRPNRLLNPTPSTAPESAPESAVEAAPESTTQSAPESSTEPAAQPRPNPRLQPLRKRAAAAAPATTAHSASTTGDAPAADAEPATEPEASSAEPSEAAVPEQDASPADESPATVEIQLSEGTAHTVTVAVSGTDLVVTVDGVIRVVRSRRSAA